MKTSPVFLLLLVSLALLLSTSFGLLYNSKVRPELRNALSSNNAQANAIIFLQKETNDAFHQLLKIENVDKRAKAVVNHKLNLKAKQHQSIVEYLQHKRVAFKSFHVLNAIAVRGITVEMVQWLQGHPLVETFSIDYQVQPDKPVEPSAAAASGERRGNDAPLKFKGKEYQWHSSWIGADKMWDQGFTGKNNIVVGLIDTGAFVNHTLLKPQFRGYDAATETIKSDYSWFDPVKGAPTPFDQMGHGSHTTGIIAGQNETYIVGNAPDAKWIMCAGVTGYSFVSSIIECFEFMLAPHNLARTDYNPDMRPHVVSNSYRCKDNIDHCSLVMKELMHVLENVGVAVVFSAGNDGPGCETISKNITFSLQIGALQYKSNDLASFSSRGPQRLADGTKLIRPDLVAPGVDILSASNYNPTNVVKKSGTSMACPMAAGAIALLWDALPGLNRDVSRSYQLLKDTASPIPVTNQCDSTGVPNNLFGYGVVSVYEAYLKGKSLGLDKPK